MTPEQKMLEATEKLKKALTGATVSHLTKRSRQEKALAGYLRNMGNQDDITIIANESNLFEIPIAKSEMVYPETEYECAYKSIAYEACLVCGTSNPTQTACNRCAATRLYEAGSLHTRP